MAPVATRRKNRFSLSAAAGVLVAAAIGLYTLFPFYWAIISSLKNQNGLYQVPPQWWPRPLQVETYIELFTRKPFPHNILNSVVVNTGTTLLCLVVGTLGAYALARLQFRGRVAALGLILSVSMFPQITVVAPLYLLLRALHLLNTYWGLILPYLAFNLPLTTWILVSFFRGLPRELEEAAFVDGCTPHQTLYKIMLPLALPGIVTAGLLTFISAWNEFLFALLFTINDQARTVPVAIALFSGEHEVQWGSIMAAAVTVTLPVIVLALLTQRRIVSGLTAGAIKD